MLKKFVIEQFVIIDKLELDFETSLTIITGDTGAGKSILLDAMGLILGDPADPKSIRSGHDESNFTAIFAPPATNPIWKALIKKDIVDHPQGEFTVRRRMDREGADEITINDKPIDLEFLKEIGEFLVEIHGQFANQTMLDPANQLKWLDQSGDFPPEVFKNVADALAEVKRYTRELDEEKKFLDEFKPQLSTIEKYVKRFDAIEMREGLIEETQVEYDMLLTAKETTDALQAILSQYIASQGIISYMKSVNEMLARQENLDPEKMVDLERLLKESLEMSHDTVNEIRRILPEYEIDTGPLNRCKKILDELHKIERETGTEFDDLYYFYVDLCGKMARIRNGRERIAELNDLLIRARNNYREHAHVLTEKRIVAGKELDVTITKEFSKLKLMKAEFQVVVEEKPDIPWTDRGFNKVIYTARMNPGMPFSPISETASGGELARMILALKVILQSVQVTPTLVFDEVDTGIGGAAAAAVGERIAKLAQATQVFVITHSPQVASRGSQHLHVSKKSDDSTTTSAVRTLSYDDRVDEIARMLAGDVVTSESQAAAKRLLAEASEAASVRTDEQVTIERTAQPDPAQEPEQADVTEDAAGQQ